MDFYLIRHLTKFLYADQVSESLMEARMHPRSDNNQRCLSFSLSVSPRCRVFSYRDHLGNNVHHFDIPGEHSQLVMVAEALVEQQPLPEIPHLLRPERVRQALARPARSGEAIGCAPPGRSPGAVAAVKCLFVSLV
jgi:transglutaminase-like putative cysteine protease